MKSSIYILIAFSAFFLAGLYLFRQWTDYNFLLAECGRVTRVTAHKIAPNPAGDQKNELGESASCVVEFSLKGRKYTQTSWNIGDCDKNKEIKIDVNDYSCG